MISKCINQSLHCINQFMRSITILHLFVRTQEPLSGNTKTEDVTRALSLTEYTWHRFQKSLTFLTKLKFKFQLFKPAKEVDCKCFLTKEIVQGSVPGAYISLFTLVSLATLFFHVLVAIHIIHNTSQLSQLSQLTHLLHYTTLYIL